MPKVTREVSRINHEVKEASEVRPDAHETSQEDMKLCELQMGCWFLYSNCTQMTQS
jgi:hypothetical protein